MESIKIVYVYIYGMFSLPTPPQGLAIILIGSNPRLVYHKAPNGSYTDKAGSGLTNHRLMA